MYDKSITCGFTGHRPTKLPWGANENDERCIKLKAELNARLEGIYEAGYRHFICGMAIGCDFYFAAAVIALREKHPDVTLEAAVPCGDQPDRWNSKLRARYNELIDQCNEVNVLQINYTPDCMLKRNEYIVDNSSLLLACYDGRPGGTMKTLLYAGRNDVKTIIIDI